MTPQDLASALELGELEPGSYSLRIPTGVALAPLASHPFWREVRALEVASPGTPVEQQRALVDLLLETGAPAPRPGPDPAPPRRRGDPAGGGRLAAGLPRLLSGGLSRPPGRRPSLA